MAWPHAVYLSMAEDSQADADMRIRTLSVDSITLQTPRALLTLRTLQRLASRYFSFVTPNRHPSHGEAFRIRTKARHNPRYERAHSAAGHWCTVWRARSARQKGVYGPCGLKRASYPSACRVSLRSPHRRGKAHDSEGVACCTLFFFWPTRRFPG